MSLSHFERASRSPRGNSGLDFVLKNLGLELPETGLILDIGSGQSALTERQGMFNNPGLAIIAADPMLAHAEYRYWHMADDHGVEDLAPAERVKSVAAVSQELPFRNSTFDFVISHAAVPEYLPQYLTDESRPSYELTFSEANRVLKPGGRVLMAPMDEFIAENSGEVLKDLGYDHVIEEIAVPEDLAGYDEWFRLSYGKQ